MDSTALAWPRGDVTRTGTRRRRVGVGDSDSKLPPGPAMMSESLASRRSAAVKVGPGTDPDSTGPAGLPEEHARSRVLLRPSLLAHAPRQAGRPLPGLPPKKVKSVDASESAGPVGHELQIGKKSVGHGLGTLLKRTNERMYAHLDRLESPRII